MLNMCDFRNQFEMVSLGAVSSLDIGFWKKQTREIGKLHVCEHFKTIVGFSLILTVTFIQSLIVVLIKFVRSFFLSFYLSFFLSFCAWHKIVMLLSSRLKLKHELLRKTCSNICWAKLQPSLLKTKACVPFETNQCQNE